MDLRWKVKTRPASIDARFVFENYDSLRVFLDDISDQTTLLDHNPSISFGKDYASIVIYPLGSELGDVDFALAKRIDECYNEATGSALV